MKKTGIPVAKGWCPTSKGYRKTVCLFDSEMHEEIRARAELEGTSFAEQVRLLVQWGLESAK